MIRSEWGVANSEWEDHSLLAVRYSRSSSTSIPKSRRYAVDRDLNAAQHLLIRVLRAVFLQKLHLHVIERIEIGEALADRAFEQRVSLQQPLLAHDFEQRFDREVPLPADAAKNLFA